MTAADHANTVRDALIRDSDDQAAFAALDALQTQAERAEEAQYEYEQMWKRREAAEHAAEQAHAALVTIAKAARPMADRPWPMSFDERREWIIDQNRLRDALNAIDGNQP